MNDHLQSLYARSAEKYASIFVANSIELQSLQKAYELASTGNMVIAEQIIEHLLIPSDVRADIIGTLYQSPEQRIPVPPPAPAPVPTRPHRPATPPPLPPIVPSPSPIEEAPMPMSIATVTVPPPVPPQPVSTMLSASPELSALLVDIHSQEENRTPPGASTEKQMQDPAKEQQEVLATILAQNAVIEKSDTHTARLSENKNTLEEIIQEKNTNSEGEMAHNAYGKVFKKPLPQNQYEVPGVIKTYDEAVDVTERKDAQQKLLTQKKIEKAKIMFTKVEEYLNKAYASGTDTLIASAERQLANLKNQYPEYVAEYKEHVQRLEQMQKNISVTASMSFPTTEIKIEKEIEEAPARVQETMPIERPTQVVIGEGKYAVPLAHSSQKPFVVQQEIHPPVMSVEQSVQQPSETETIAEQENNITPSTLDIFEKENNTTTEAREEKQELVGLAEHIITKTKEDPKISLPKILDSVSLANMDIHAGMRITGEQDIYTVARIEQYGDYTRVVFEGDISDNMYSVPTADLEQALHVEDLHPDTFFASFVE